MMPFQKILFPVDFSSACEAMAPYVREMAHLCTAQVAVLHSFDFVRGYDLAGRLDPTGEFVPSPIPYDQWAARLRARREEQLRSFVREQFPQTVCRAIMEDGDAARIIHGVAQRDGIDLIMLPTKGSGIFRSLLLGSVAAKVLHDVDCAVFTTVHELDPGRAHSAGFRSIVCAIDPNEGGPAVLKTAGLLAQGCGARLSILHLVQGRSQDPPANAGALARDALAQESEATGATRVLHDNFVEGIRAAAIEASADLVIVGRGQDHSTLPLLRSHLYQIVRQSPCPVLSV